MLKTIDENYELEKKNKLEELEKIKNDFLINSENNKNILKSYIKSKLQNCIIPLVIYQTWMTKLLPDKMMKSVEKLKKANPEFEYKLFDDTDCRNFIDLHFNSNVLFAYDNLVPGAFKADLWRYCVLFIYGGIYIDIKYEPVNNFKLIDLIDKNHFVLDRPGFFKGHVGIYNGFIISEPNNTIFLKLINAVVDNVKNKYYGNNPLAVTGPSLVGKTLYPTNDKCTPAIEKSFELKYSLDGTGIEYNNKKILTQYLDYRKDQIKFTKTTYHILWEKRKIFKF
jgi:mannosyltransferase OCH1-like enzyme